MNTFNSTMAKGRRFAAAPMRAAIVCLVAGAVGGIVSADTLQLKDGTLIAGSYLGGDYKQVDFKTDRGDIRSIRMEEIRAIFMGSGTPDAAGAASLAAANVPAGMTITIRTTDNIDSNVNGVGEEFRGVVAEAVSYQGEVLIPADTSVTLEVTKVEQAGALSGKDEIAIRIKTLSLNGRDYVVAAGYAEIASAEKASKTAELAGAGAAGGAVLGWVLGGEQKVKKAAEYGMIGGAGAAAIAATRGSVVKVPSESLLSFTLASPLVL